MIETHPFGDYIPENVQYLMLGSFTGKNVPIELGYDWYYGTKRNQFWKILESVYSRDLSTKEQKVSLFSELKMALSDIIKQCERKKGSNLDNNLINIIYNFDAIENILIKNQIKKVFFTSRFVESKFRKLFKSMSKFEYIEFVTLPSPSPRYAKLSVGEKAKIYESLLPKV